MQGFALGVVIAAVMLIAACIVTYILLLRQGRRYAERLRFEHGRVKNERNAREQAEAALELQDQLFKILFDHTTDMVFIYGITDDGLPDTFSDVNTVACEKLEYERDKLLELGLLDVEVAESRGSIPGYTRSELVTLSDQELMDRESTFAVRPARQVIQQILQAGQIEYARTYLTRTGKQVPVSVNAHRFELDGKPMIICTAHDVSERRKAEQALRESERRFQEFFSKSPVGVALYNGEHELLNVNQSFLKMFGVPDQEQFSRFNPFDNPFLPDEARTMLGKGETAQFNMTVDFDQVRSENHYLTARKADAHFDVLLMNLGLDQSYAPRGYLMQVQDVTHRVETEKALRRSERLLQQGQKMEALGTLAGGIAHDFNNILTPILGYTEIMLHTIDDDDSKAEYVREIHSASYRARELVQQILAFSRQGEQDNKPIRLTPIVKEVIKLQESSAPDGITFRYDIRTDKDMVVANPTQVHQVVMNLCVNAVYAMQETGGELEIRVTDFMVGGRAHTEFPDLEPGRYLRLSIKDTGTGIEENALERIFDPFFTTKPSGEGTGMGLAVVHGIVTNLRGTLRAESTVGAGSTFHVILPVIDQVSEEKDKGMQDISKPVDGEARILFVDDEASVTRMAARMLRTLGYEPVVSLDSREALDMIRSNPSQYDLLITDLAMPGLPGIEFAAKVLEIRPDLPIMLCTGYSRQYSKEQAVEKGFVGVIRKPIIMRELADAVNEALTTNGPD